MTDFLQNVFSSDLTVGKQINTRQKVKTYSNPKTNPRHDDNKASRNVSVKYVIAKSTLKCKEDLLTGEVTCGKKRKFILFVI